MAQTVVCLSTELIQRLDEHKHPINVPLGIDTPIFHNLQSNECIIPPSTINKDYITCCDYLQRIAHGLQLHQSLCENKIGQDSFIQFCQETYSNFLDDYCHFIKYHNYHITQIKQELQSKYSLIPCKINKCQVISRHYRPSNQLLRQNDDINDESYTFYIDCFDQLHHQIWHIHDIGLRVERKHRDQYSHDIDEDFVDHEFRSMKQIIFQKREKFGVRNIERLNNETNTKFIVNTNSNTDDIKSGKLTFCVSYKHILIHCFLLYRKYIFRCSAQ